MDEESFTLAQMLEQMDNALLDEIKVQQKKSGSHIAVDGSLITKQTGQYLYIFTLQDSWEPQDDTPFKIKFGGSQDIKGTIVTSTGTTITVATEEPLPPEALSRISLVDDPTQLLERLREALKSQKEEVPQLGSKSFGFLPFISGRRTPSATFGKKFIPDSSQKSAIQAALGSEVTYIIGPPGTGKTSTLAAIAFSHLQEGRTVLIAAHTNIAVDNAVIRLAQMCKEANAIHELRDGRIIRFGMAQLEERLKNEHGEVHLKTIVERRIGKLKQEREYLQEHQNQISAQLSLLAQEKVQKTEQLRTERQRLITQRDICKRELRPIEVAERQRIAVLDEQSRDLARQLTQAQQQAQMIHQKLAAFIAQQAHQQTTRSQLLPQINDLTVRLTTTQQMNPVKRFFKGVHPQKLAQQLTDRKQHLWQVDQDLVALEGQINEMHSTYAAIKKHVEQLTLLQSNVTMQRNMPTMDAQKIVQLQAAIANHEQAITRIDIQLRQAQSDAVIEQRELKSQIDHVKEQLATIDKQMASIEKSIVEQARVVATTLCKTYMNSNVRERPFDVVIIDEVSMAPLPVVYIVASRANSSTVLIGDPRQLAPIYTAETPIARKWLGKDLFDYRNMTIENRDQATGGIMLEVQARMHPQISHIARKHVYSGKLRDRPTNAHEKYSAVKPLPGKALLLCDTSDASPFTIRPEGSKSRINVYHALCTMEIACQVLASLPPSKHPFQMGEFRVGIVTPYAKQAELLQQMIKEANLKDVIRAGTVHRFQGLEAEVIIFDTVDSPPLSPSPLTSSIQGSDSAMRLTNVAVTRAKHKLIIVANSQYIRTQLHANDTLRLAVQEAQLIGSINSRDILSMLSQPPRTPSLNPLADRKSQRQSSGHSTDVDISEVELFDDRTFYERFLNDIRSATKRAIIFSPFLSIERTRQLIPVFSEKRKTGMNIMVITSSSRKNNPTYNEAGKLLKDAGVELRTASGMHEKLVIIDEAIVYAGSLNVLSHGGGTTEFMVRQVSSGFAKKIMLFKNVDAIIKAPTRWGASIEISLQELPPMNCKKCGKAMTIKNGQYGFFYGCTGYPACTNTGDIGEQQLNSIERLVNMHCGGCGGKMTVRTNRKDAWMMCESPIACDFGQRITYTKFSS